MKKTTVRDLKVKNESERLSKTQADLMQEINEEKQNRLKSCMAEMEVLVKKWNCDLSAEAIISAEGLIKARPLLVAL